MSAEPIPLPMTRDLVRARVMLVNEQIGLSQYDAACALQDQLWRDVLFCIRQGASHARDLADEALKAQWRPNIGD